MTNVDRNHSPVLDRNRETYAASNNSIAFFQSLRENAFNFSAR